MTGAAAGAHGRGVQLGNAVEQLASTEGWKTAYPLLDQAGAGALDALVAGLAHPHPRVRQWCAALLDHHADERCVPGLLRLLRDPVAGVRRHALHSIGCQPCKPSPLPIDAVPLLLELTTSDPSVRVRRAAAHMLGLQPPDARAAAGLRLVAGRDPDARVRSNARWALARHTGDSPAGAATSAAPAARQTTRARGGIAPSGSRWPRPGRWTGPASR